VSSEASPHGVGESAGGFGFFLVVSPAAGRIRHLPPARFHEGDEWVSAGQAVAVVEQGSQSIEVKSPFEARVAGILVRDGEPVLPGQPLVWLEGGAR
jgi:biotin carboxyl carrier protein